MEILSNMEYYKDDVAKQQRFITDLKADLRKSQHRLEIITDKAHLEDQEFIKSIRRETSPLNRSRIASPLRLRSPKLDKYRRDYSAEKRQAKERKQEIDDKITILENYMVHSNSNSTAGTQAPLKSALKNPLNRLLQTQSPPEPRVNPTNHAMSV